MQPWVNFLVQVSKPVLKTLVYAGTSLILEQIQEEIKKKQQLHSPNLLTSLGNEGKKIKKVKEKIKSSAPNSNVNLLEVSAQGHQPELEEQPSCITPIPHPLPLQLLSSQVLNKANSNDNSGLKILITPLQTPKIEGVTWQGQEIENQINQGLQEFIIQHYSREAETRKPDFLGNIWRAEAFQDESNVKAILGLLSVSSTVIIESEQEENYYKLRLAYKIENLEKYYHKTILKLPYRKLLEYSALGRAKQWKKNKEKLIVLGKTPEEINNLGGDNTANLVILEEIEALKKAGVKLEDINFKYQFNRKDIAILNEGLKLNYCLIAGWITELHYYLHHKLPPRLPEWLPQITEDLYKLKLLRLAISALVDMTETIVTQFAPQQSEQIPRLVLQLAQSVLLTGDRILAKEQVIYSLKKWLKHHELSRLEDIKNIKSQLCLEDWEYLEKIKACLLVLNEEKTAKYLEQLLQKKTEIPRQITTANCTLSETLTHVSTKVNSLVITSDGQHLLSENGGIIERWYLNKNSKIFGVTQKLSGHSAKECLFTFSPDGQILASSEKMGHRNYIKVWHLPTGKLEKTLFGHRQPIHSLAISQGKSDRYILASGSRKIKLWDLETGESFLTLFGHTEWIYTLAISPSEDYMISGSQDKSLRVWDLQTGKLIHLLQGHQGSIKTLAITPNGEKYISGSDDQTLKLWDFQTGKLLHTFTGHTGAINSAVISPNGKLLMSGSQDKTIRIWNLQTGELLQILTDHQQEVLHLAISPDGQKLVSASEDMTIKLWQVGAISNLHKNESLSNLSVTSGGIF